MKDENKQEELSVYGVQGQGDEGLIQWFKKKFQRSEVV